MNAKYIKKLVIVNMYVVCTNIIPIVDIKGE